MGKRNPFMPPGPRARVCPIRVAAMRLAVERRYLGVTNVLLQHETKRESHHVGTVRVNGAIVCCEEFDREPCPHQPERRCKDCPGRAHGIPRTDVGADHG